MAACCLGNTQPIETAVKDVLVAASDLVLLGSFCCMFGGVLDVVSR
jgi:hypothetical protein